MNLLLPLCLFACAGRSNQPPPDEIALIEEEVLSIVNSYRASRGLGILRHDRALAGIARRHSAGMALGTVPFGHAGFRDRVETIKAFHGRSASVGENVAYNNADPERCAAVALENWLLSPGHKANLERDFLFTGIGVARDAAGGFYLTQLFMR